MQEMTFQEIDAVSGGDWMSAGEAVGGALLGIGLASGVETFGVGFGVAAVGAVVLGFSAGADFATGLGARSTIFRPLA